MVSIPKVFLLNHSRLIVNSSIAKNDLKHVRIIKGTKIFATAAI